MRLAVLRVSSATSDLAEVLREFSLTPDVHWRKGERRPSGKAAQHSGFNLTVSEAETSEALVLGIAQFVERFSPLLTSLHHLGASAVLDIGVSVGTSASFIASVTLAPELLQQLSRTGLAVEFSAYPASEE